MSSTDLARRHVLLIGALAVWQGAFGQSSGTVDAAALMRQVQEHGNPRDETVRLEMKLVDASGKKSERAAWFWRMQREAGSTRAMKLIRFDAPAELAGSAVLTLENAERADDQWLYLPAYHTSRKIPSSNRSDRYMGTDFYYEDVSDDRIEDYRYAAIGEESIGGRRYVVIEQVPVADVLKRESAYGQKKQWVDPERHVVARVNYLDRQGKAIKRFDASGPVQVAGRWRWSSATMIDLVSSHRTELTYRDRQIDTGLNAQRFSVRALERGR